METGKPGLRRYSFILTFWEERGTRGEAGAVWRFRLEHLQSHERRGFKRLRDLVAFFEQWTANPPADEPASEE